MIQTGPEYRGSSTSFYARQTGAIQAAVRRRENSSIWPKYKTMGAHNRCKPHVPPHDPELDELMNF